MSGVSMGGRSGLFDSNLEFSVAAGLAVVPGVTRITALGHNPNIVTQGTAADIWEGGGDYPFLATSNILEVVSASTNDTSAGTGVRTVLISGLDSARAVITETVTLNGTLPVNTVNSFLRVNLFTSVTSGSGGVNAGDITLRVTGGGTTQSIMRAGYGFGRSAVYSIPNGFTLFVTSQVFTILNPSGATLNSVVCGLQQRSSTGNKRIPLEFQVTSSQPYRHDAHEGIVLAQNTDAVLRITSTGQANTNVSGAFIGFLFDNTKLIGL